jgi:hypothetical protein
MRVTIAFALVALAVLASCVQVAVVGTHRDAISRDDTAQIKRLVSERRDLPCDFLTIRPLSANTAAVESSDEYTGLHTFSVRKAHGEWKVDDATIQRRMVLH